MVLAWDEVGKALFSRPVWATHTHKVDCCVTVEGEKFDKLRQNRREIAQCFPQSKVVELGRQRCHCVSLLIKLLNQEVN